MTELARNWFAHVSCMIGSRPCLAKMTNKLSFLNSPPPPLHYHSPPHCSTSTSSGWFKVIHLNKKRMAVRPQCCPCGSPVYTPRQASPEWFTHANCARTTGRYSSINTSRSLVRRPSPAALQARCLHAPQFADSDPNSAEFIMSLRPSQFY